MTYLKLFNTHSEYEAFTATTDFILPNVSHCIQEVEVHYNPWVETRVVCKYNVTSTSEPTALRTNYEQNVFKSMEVDGVMLDELVTAYTFDSIGVHTVKYELYDETKLGNGSPTFYNNNLIEAKIPSSVTSIGSNVFNSCASLSICTFDKNSQLTTIGGAAFVSCTSLTSIDIPNSVTNIGDSAFYGCTSLTSITIDAETPPTLGASVFHNTNNCPIYVPSCESALSYMSNWTAYANRIKADGCDFNNMIIYASSSKLSETTADKAAGLHTNSFSGSSGQLTITSHEFSNGVGIVMFNDDVTSVGENAFRNSSDLTSVNIPNSVTSIGGSAFSSCGNITSINIPDSVINIDTNAFYYCSGLTSVTIGSGVTSIGSSAFTSCSGLESITVDSNNTVYDSRNNCNAIIETSTNTLIVGCKNTVIPNTVTSIGSSAFYGCSGLTSVTIPNGVTTIGSSAFTKCSSLTSIEIPNSVTSIDKSAVNGCSSLTTIISNATTAPTVVSNTFQNVKTYGTLYVPIGSSGYNIWMSTGNFYLGSYHWTKVEQ